MMQLEPLNTYVVIKKMERDAVSKGGIIIPEQAQERPSQGRVMFVGSACKFLKSDDVVLFGKYAGSEIKLDEDTFLLLKEEDIFTKLKQGEE